MRRSLLMVCICVIALSGFLWGRSGTTVVRVAGQYRQAEIPVPDPFYTEGPVVPMPTTTTSVIPFVPHSSPHEASRSEPIHIASTSPPVVVLAGSGGVAVCIRDHEWNPREGYATYDPPFYGAYQYDIPTWARYGGYYRADLAPPAVQDAKFWADWNSDTPARRHAEWPKSSRECGF